MVKTAFLLYSWRLLNSGMPTAKETGKLRIQQMQLHHAGAFRTEHDVLPDGVRGNELCQRKSNSNPGFSHVGRFSPLEINRFRCRS
jgi:hypothetical protein